MTRRALIICAPSPLEIGHAPVGTVKVVRAMLDMGWEVDILGFRWKAGTSSDSFFSSMLDGARIFEAEGFFGKPSGWVPKAVRAGRRLLATNRYTLLLSFAHLTWTHVVGLLLKRATGVPWVTFSTDPWSNFTLLSRSRVRRAVERNFESRTYLAADALVFTCHQLQTWMIGQFPARSTISAKSFSIPYFFDARLFPPVSRSGANGRIVIRHIGTIPPGGYVSAFLEAVRRLLDNDSALEGRLIVAFHGGYRPNPHELVRRLRLENCVEFHPSVDYPESLRLMKDSDALLFIGVPPRDLGGLGNATLHLKFCDYIGAERPIFALAGTGSPAHEALRGTVGLCAKEDPAAVAEALRGFLARRDLPDGKVRERFSRQHVVRLWEDVFDFVGNRWRTGQS